MNTPKIEITDGQVYYEFSDGSSIRFAPGEFEKRTCIEDFMEDGDFMPSIVEYIREQFTKRPVVFLSEEEHETNVLTFLNSAYEICSQLIEQGKPHATPTKEIRLPWNRKASLSFPYYIAYMLIKCTRKFYAADLYNSLQIDQCMINICINRGVKGFTKELNEAIDPICFGKIRRNIPKPEKAVKSDTMEDTLSRTLEGVNTLYNSLQEKEKQLNEAFGKVAILETLLAQHKEEIQELNHRLANQEPKIVEVIKEKVVEKKVPSGEGLNLETMTDYALTLQKDDEVQVIINFMNHLLVEDLYSGKGLKQLIKKLETHRRNLQKPVVSQVNTFHDGSSFNDIHDNDNAKINTNGRR